MKVIIAWDGDHIGREVGRASLADDVEGLRRISQAIDLGNRIWESWVTMNGGSIISFGGDEGRAEILAEKLMELPKVRDQYAQAVGSTVSVGVGTKLSEADRALLAGKLQGGDKIVLYTPEVDELIAKLQQNRSEGDKLKDEYLTKGEEKPPEAGGDHGGFSGASKPAPPSVAKPKAEASEHSQGEAAANMLANENPPPPESTASMHEQQFHDAAQKQGAQDQGQQQSSPQGDQLRVQVVQTLQALKQQMPILEQVKQSAPDTYQAVMGLAQAVISMARAMNGDDPNQTGAGEIQDRAKSNAMIDVPQPPEEGGESGQKSGQDGQKEEKAEKAEKAYRLEGDALIEVDPKTGKSLGKGPVNKGEWHDQLPGGEADDKTPDDFDLEELKLGMAHEQEHTDDPALALEIAMDHLMENPKYYSEQSKAEEKAKKEHEEAMEKATLEANKTPATHHHLQLPVGSKVDPGPEGNKDVGKIKVQHTDTQGAKQGWVQARAGMVLSQDGHAISSRNPGGK